MIDRPQHDSGPNRVPTRVDRPRPAEDPQYSTIAERLEMVFGNGVHDDLRGRLYDRLQDEAIQHGEPVYRVISAVARTALSAREPTRYFAAAVTRRLREQGYLADDTQPF